MYEPSQARSSSRFIIQTLLSPRRLKDADRSPSWRIHTVAEPRLGQFKTKNGLLRIKLVATALIHANAEIIPTTPQQHWDSDFLPVGSASLFLPCLFHSHANFHILSRLFFYFCFPLLPASISTFVETRIATGFVCVMLDLRLMRNMRFLGFSGTVEWLCSNLVDCLVLK